MNGVTITRFGDFSDPVKIAKQLAESVNRLEQLFQNLPVYFGPYDPNDRLPAQAGSLFIRTGAQGQNTAAATPHLYIKTQDSGNNSWLALLYLGSQAQTEVSAFRGSLYLKIAPELTTAAAIYLKTADDAATTGWAAL